MSLRGRKRYRRSWFGKIVLQVEHIVPYSGDPTYGCPSPSKVWRDATIQDILNATDC